MSWRDRQAPAAPPRRPRPPARTWAPRPNATPVQPAIGRELEVRWSTDARGHLAIYRPPCGVAGCRLPSMTWCRCRACRKVLGRCRDHVLDQPLVDVRAAHCQESAGG